VRRVFKTRYFARWIRKTDLNDVVLCGAIREMEQGLIDADLGGGLFRKRVAVPGRGKSGGARTLIATNRSDRWLFGFGFEKNEKQNVDEAELTFLKRFAGRLLDLSELGVDSYLADGSIQEICHE